MDSTRLYDALIAPLRLLDEQEGGDLLRSLLERPQYHADATRTLIHSLPDTDSPVSCRDDLLQYLKAHVGFGSELSQVIADLSPAALRKLILIAVPFWRDKGSAQNIVATGRALTGRDPLYQDWFDRRFLVGESRVGENQNGVPGTALGTGAEYYSGISVMDDGALDEALLLELVRLLRPVGERIEITLLDFLDLFTGTLDRWQHVSGDPASIAGGVMHVPPGNYTRAVVTCVTPYEMHDTVSDHRFALGASGNVHWVRWSDTIRQYLFVGGYYKLEITDLSPQLTISINLNGTVTNLYQGDLVGGATIVPGVYYRLRIEAPRVGYYPFLRVYLDDILQYQSPAGGEPYPQVVAGDFMLGADDENSVDNLVTNVALWRLPKRWARADAAGVTTSDTYYG